MRILSINRIDGDVESKVDANLSPTKAAGLLERFRFWVKIKPTLLV
jgi:hypothetical protein